VLILHKRVIEKVLMIFFAHSLDELAGEEKTKWIKHIETLQSFFNVLALGNEQKPGHWKCRIKNDDEVGDYSFTDGQATLIEKQLAPVIEKALTLQESRKDYWTKVVKKTMWILTTLCQ
jgi:hypothetical protein